MFWWVENKDVREKYQNIYAYIFCFGLLVNAIYIYKFNIQSKILEDEIQKQKPNILLLKCSVRMPWFISNKLIYKKGRPAINHYYDYCIGILNNDKVKIVINKDKTYSIEQID